MRTLPTRRARRARARLGALAAFAMLLPACALLSPPDPVTVQAERVDDLYSLIFGVAIVIFVVVEGLLLWSVVRYRRRDDRLPSQFHGNTLIEILWTAIPTLIVAIIFVLSIQALNVVEERTEDPLIVEVSGFQWQWRFTYPQGDGNSDDDPFAQGTEAEPAVLRLPVGEPVRLVLDSRDVVHAFYVPQFLIKRDVNPYPEGQPLNTLEFTITEAGEYSGQCAEFCGRGHNAMTFVVHAMPRAEFDAWLAEQGGQGPPPGGPGESAPPPATASPGSPAPSPSEPAETGVTLVAENIAFNTDLLEVPAGRPFTLTLDNRDAGVPHNVSIYDAAGAAVFEGEIFAGVATRDYSVPALPPGEYRFVCDVHPTTMVGTLISR